MATSWGYISDLVAFTPTKITGTEDTARPITRVGQVKPRPLVRVARNLDLLQWEIECDLGADKALKAVLFFNVNATSVEVEHTTAALHPSFTPFTGSAFTPAKGEPDPYYNIFIEQDVTAREVWRGSPPRYEQEGESWQTSRKRTGAALSVITQPKKSA